MLKRITAPAPLFTVAEAKKHCNELSNDFDLQIDGLIAAVTEWADGPEGCLNGRCLGPQTWDWSIDAVACPPWYDPWTRGAQSFLELPLRPVLEVVHVKYLDSDGAEQTWTDWEALGEGLGVVGPTLIQPTLNNDWPQVGAVRNALTVRMIAGYGQPNGESPAVTVEAVPGRIKSALLLRLADLFDNREGAGEPSRNVQDILAEYRIWR